MSKDEYLKKIREDRENKEKIVDESRKLEKYFD